VAHDQPLLLFWLACHEELVPEVRDILADVDPEEHCIDLLAVLQFFLQEGILLFELEIR